FDLVQSPLLEAHCGKGSVTLCQVDVTPRYGRDPVSTRLVDNLLRAPMPASAPPQQPCAFVGASASEFAGHFGIKPEGFTPATRGVILVGREPLAAAAVAQLEDAAREGATVLLLPGAPVAAFGLQTRAERLFIAKPSGDPLLTGTTMGDLYLKALAAVPCGLEQDGWHNLTTPGLLSAKTVGRGRVVACGLDPEALGQTRGRVKALRLWNTLLTNAGVERSALSILAPARPYEDNEWEHLPPYMDW
ncbi:MAG: hypothetical protein WCP21_08695, partial [Armatimonadota bacterium]